jgi:hypothetical protein
MQDTRQKTVVRIGGQGLREMVGGGRDSAGKMHKNCKKVSKNARFLQENDKKCTEMRVFCTKKHISHRGYFCEGDRSQKSGERQVKSKSNFYFGAN